MTFGQGAETLDMAARSIDTSSLVALLEETTLCSRPPPHRITPHTELAGCGVAGFSEVLDLAVLNH